PLVTEAVRGEGATLVDGAGASVMAGVHPLGDLAPRDVVAAAITRRQLLAPGGIDDHVFLDATGIPGFAKRFPTVHAACAVLGIDPAVDAIPVTPAAHFACGGVVATVDGRSSVRGLYAAGEVARTGLHGANRLASNSLLEGLVVGQRTAEAVVADLAAGLLPDPARGRIPERTVAPAAERDVLQRVMSRYAAIGRDADGLAAAGSALDLSTTDSPLWTHRAVEDAALTLAAQALLAAAERRTESRGCHVRTDFPERDEGLRRSQLIRLSPSGQPVLVEATSLEGVA
ncbi:FAD-binding protein, partial [Amycolatopsis sp. NPDC000673]